ncbi:MAG: radical SAM family heme chaperone HemW [Candidatus Margulisiibacteriota bacterium]|nr:radical SAM family heme chaperone HemW [Candidatus Margulisiibacteriota bacterium]
MTDEKVGLYIHVPFCIKVCPYCAFYKMTYSKEYADIFLNNLIKEMRLYYNQYGSINVNTIFFGGGTPNILPKKMFEALFDAMHRYFNVASSAEISMEMNPGVHSLSKLMFFKQLGINRVSIGVQSFKNNVLDDYGRNHTDTDTVQFINDVKTAGFNNISVDIIFGHPNHNHSDLEFSINKLIEYSFNHVALYGLTVEKNTPFHTSGLVINNDDQADSYNYIQRALSNAGFNQYEVSNFSKPGYESCHNIKYWTFQPTIGLGAGAHSYFLRHRYSNHNDFKTYTDNLRMVLPVSLANPCDISEYLAVRLRYKSPLYFKDIETLYSVNDLSKLSNNLINLKKSGYVEVRDDSFNINERGFQLLDEIICHLV